MTTEKKISANQLNALKSTGPKTLEGKRRSRMNALKHGLYSNTVPVRPEELPDFKALCLDLFNEHSPVGTHEISVFKDLVLTRWRLQRFQRAEAELFEAYRHYRFGNKEQKGDYGTAIAHDLSQVGSIPRNLACEDVLHKRYYGLLDRLEAVQSKRRREELQAGKRVEMQ